MKNNIKQDVKEVKATITPNTDNSVSIETTTKVSRETYNDYTTKLVNIVNYAKISSMELARLFTEMDERKVLEFEVDEQDGKRPVRFANLSDYSEAVLGKALSDKQLADYKKVVHKFGVRAENGTYTIDEKYTAFGFSALEIIGRRCKDKEDFDKVLALYSITSSMSDNRIKNAITTKDNEDKGNTTTDKDNTDKDTTKKDTAKELKETQKELKKVQEKLEKAETFEKGAISHYKELRKIATDNNLTPILEYMDKWMLGLEK